MGRSSKNKKRRASFPQAKGKSKRWKKELFWIQDCADSKVHADKSYRMQVVITRADLEDDYVQVPQPLDTVDIKDDTHSDNISAVDASKPHPSLKQVDPSHDVPDGETDKIQNDIGDANCNEGDASAENRKEENAETTTQVEENIANGSQRIQNDAEICDANFNEEVFPGTENTKEGTTESTMQVGQNIFNTSHRIPDNATAANTPSKIEDSNKTKSASIVGSSNDETSCNRSSSSKSINTEYICVRRAEAPKKGLKNKFSEDDFKPLPNGDCGDGIVNPYPKTEVPDKFWSQRRRLFSRFDDGVVLDKESWYSVTPEAIANHIAARMVASQKNVIVMDPFCGCGGNSVAFARRKEVSLVVCVDIDLDKLKKAANNARIYNIPPEKMVFVHADGCRVMKLYKNCVRSKLDSSEEDSSESENFEDSDYKVGGLHLLPERLDTIFLSPPWGGMEYTKVGKRNYDLACIQINGGDEGINGEELLKIAAQALGKKLVVYFLPRNTNGINIGRSALKAGYASHIELEQHNLNGKLKTVSAYFGLSST